MPIYHSEGNQSITSLSQIYNGATVVYLDETIGHLQTREIASIDDYYDVQYEFFNQSDEDDILYKVVDGKKIFRQQHQVDTLLKKVTITAGMRVLDYGCAKGTVMKRLAAQRPDVIPHLFDVSQMYVRLWEQFLPAQQYASYQPKTEWTNSLDLVTSFFAFEHTPNPLKELATIKSLLKVGGVVYLIVPNVFENTGDFIVADHVHHYSEVSLRYMLAKAGFETLEIDATSHFGAFIAVAKKTTADSIPYTPAPTLLASINAQCKEIANYWNGLQNKIREFEQTHSNQKSAIYGAGVYGNFIATCLQNSENLVHFIDQNPLLHHTTIQGKTVIKPEELPADTTVVYVGINPVVAKGIIENIAVWKDKTLQLCFL
jgi:2-polyprenyl-3-methyl-5-hydroxy-6-metoxy-1,4-benzoquinol methylase